LGLFRSFDENFYSFEEILFFLQSDQPKILQFLGQQGRFGGAISHPAGLKDFPPYDIGFTFRRESRKCQHPKKEYH
jgi:hypothetical protein